MSAALGLYRLQQVDSQIDQIQSRLKTIQQTLENDVELQAAVQTVNSAEAIHKKASQALKESEAEFEKQRIKIEQTESSLYSGTVKNPKELQDLQMEIVSLKKHLVTLEERELEAMLQTETAEKEMQVAKEFLQQVELRLKTQNSGLTTESDALHKDLERVESERKAVRDSLDADHLKTYEQLRKQKRGVAVSLLSEKTCSACGTTFTASQEQNARSTTQLFNCPNCGRIIYTD